MVDAKELQKILLKHFKGKKYEKGRIASNLAQAINLLSLPFF